MARSDELLNSTYGRSVIGAERTILIPSTYYHKASLFSRSLFAVYPLGPMLGVGGSSTRKIPNVHENVAPDEFERKKSTT